MAKSSYVNIVKPARKRSSATGTLVGVRLQDDELKAIDNWARNQEPQVTRPYAIRCLVELGLSVKMKSAPSERQRAALADLASKAIDSLTVGTANSDEKASRKRRLIKGPEEFREVRVDRPGKKRS
jgi:hypothetical protein